MSSEARSFFSAFSLYSSCLTSSFRLHSFYMATSNSHSADSLAVRASSLEMMSSFSQALSREISDSAAHRSSSNSRFLALDGSTPMVYLATSFFKVSLSDHTCFSSASKSADGPRSKLSLVLINSIFNSFSDLSNASHSISMMAIWLFMLWTFMRLVSEEGHSQGGSSFVGLGTLSLLT